MEERIMNIVFICDDNYAMPTGVAISSLAKHKKEESNYRIHIIINNVSEKNVQYFKKLQQENFEIVLIKAENFEKYQQLEKKTQHVSFTACYKFDLPNMLPDVDKVLYLDCDLLIKRDLDKLFEENIDDLYAAVVKDKKPETYNPPLLEQLHLNHKFYFNTGVMLLNLKKMREDNMTEKLFEYRKNGINFFMDQDAFNVVFEEKVNYISFFYNLIFTNIDLFSVRELSEYYELPYVRDKKEYYDKATIIHLASKYKPWEFEVPYFSNLYKKYYSESVYSENPLELKAIPGTRVIPEKFLNDPRFTREYIPNFNGLNTFEKRKEKIIISLTTFPERMSSLYIVLKSLLNQILLPDRVIVYLAKEQFENVGLPFWMEIFEEAGIIFKWCDEDLKSHKKYYYAMQEYPDDIVITVDDDVVYARDLVKNLYAAYENFPSAVIANRAHRMTFNEDGSFKLYDEWGKIDSTYVGVPMMDLVATGIAGVLYPPHSLSKKVFDKDAIISTCIHTDDLWLKAMEVENNTPVVLADLFTKVKFVDGTQEFSLFIQNVGEGRNDVELRNIEDLFEKNGWGNLTEKIKEYCIDEGVYKKGVEYLSSLLKHKQKQLEKTQRNERKIKRMYNKISRSRTYKIGLFFIKPFWKLKKLFKKK